MSEGRSRPIFGLIGGAAFVAWALAAHITSQQADPGHWAVALATLPLLMAAFGALRGLTHRRLPLIAAIAACCALLFVAWPLLRQNVHTLYLIQHVGINAALGVLFGHTLFGGRKPLVTHFAAQVHERMTPALLRYTRGVTLAWTLFFVAMIVASLLLHFLGPIEIWSLLANVLTLPLVGAMFLAEVLARHLILPPADRLGIRDTIRAYRLAMARRRATGSFGNDRSPRAL